MDIFMDIFCASDVLTLKKCLLSGLIMLTVLTIIMYHSLKTLKSYFMVLLIIVTLIFVFV